MPSKGAVLVTDATRRIGLAIAARLARDGYDVALHASPCSHAQGEKEAARLAQQGGKTCLVIGDLADSDSCHALVANAATALGRLTVLVNNASVFEPDSPEAIDLLLWDRHFAVNLRAPVILSQHFAAQAPAERDASIVNVVDQRVLRPTSHFFSYGLSRSALWTATQTMAQAFASSGIRVNAIGLGLVLPDATEVDIGFAKEVETLPLHPAVIPDDVAKAVLYLASAKGVAGQMITVDTGQHLA